MARIGTVVLAFLVVCSGYLLIGRPKTSRLILLGVAFTTGCLIVYLVSSMEYVRRIEIPSNGKAILVSIGSVRSDFAIKEFGSESDWDLLRDRGPNEEEIYKLWTPQSIIWARLSLFLPYLGIVLGWTFCFTAFMALELTHDHDS